MTDSEIVKALECLKGRALKCRECPYSSRYPFPLCQQEAANDALKLITRQQAEIENYIKVAERQQSLSLERDFEIKRLRAEIEKLKQPLNVRFEKFESEYDSKIKSEARREFAERLHEKVHVVPTVYNSHFGRIVDNLLKEMERET